MRVRLLIFFSLVLVVLLAGCVKPEKLTEIKYKNDIITIENFNIDNLSPYSGGRTTLSFDVVNNGDREVQYLEVNFFDIPGFTPQLECQIVEKDENSDGIIDEKKIGNICAYENLGSLDSRTIKLELKAPKVNYPTEYKISYSIGYVNYGIREALIPVIDGVTKKQSSGQFRQSEPTFGPIQADIQPKLEREVKVGDKTITQYWAIANNTFETNFKFTHIGAVTGQKKEINITSTHIRMKLNGLDNQIPCEFSSSNEVDFAFKDFKDKITQNDVVLRQTEEAKITGSASTKNVIIPKDSLICVFSPTVTGQPESTASIALVFAYKYEFIRSESFAIQPLR